MKTTKYKVFSFGKRVASWEFEENETLTREKIEKINILNVLYNSLKDTETKNKYFESLVLNWIDGEVKRAKEFFEYKIIFEDEKDFEKDILYHKTEKEILKEKLKEVFTEVVKNALDSL